MSKTQELLQYLLDRQTSLEKKLKFEKSVDAKATVAEIERELQITNLAIDAIDEDLDTRL